MPAVSIIIPTYNRAEKLDYSLKHLINQTFKDFEVLICDDGSTDNTETVAKAYEKKLSLKYFRIENSGGPAGPRNICMRAAQAPIIAFLDSDDWWTSDKLERCLPFFEKGADVVYHTLFFAKEVDQVFHRKMRVRKLRSPVFEDMLFRGHTNPTSGTMVRKSLLEQVGGFSEENDLIGWEDYDCWLKLAKITENFFYVPLALGYYRIGTDNLTTASRALENVASMKKHYFNDESGKLPFWYYDRKSFAYHELKYHKLAYQNKLLALKLAPTIALKWNIAKVLVKWIFRIS